MAALGITGKSSHSIRKGAITLLTCGSPDIAPLIPVLVRARWTTQAFLVLLKYAKFDGSGDCLIGRMLALLDQQKPEFSVIAPHFRQGSEGETRTPGLVADLFGCVSELPGILRAAPWLVASLIYHWDYLKKTLPSSHQLWKSPLGRFDEREIRSLQADISIQDDNGRFIARGVPTSSKLLGEVRESRQETQRWLEKMEEQVKQTGDDVTSLVRMIPETVAGMTMRVRSNEFREFVNEFTGIVKENMSEFFPKAPEPPVIERTSEKGEEQVALTSKGYPVYEWGGGPRFIPSNFNYTRSTKIRSAWDLWCGVKCNHMPLCMLMACKGRNDVLDTVEPRKRKQTNSSLIELETTMRFIENHAESESVAVLKSLLLNAPEQGEKILIANQVELVWKQAWARIKESYEWQTQRKHDIEKLALRTVYKHITAKLNN
jgi:hypothetical protein